MRPFAPICLLVAAAIGCYEAPPPKEAAPGVTAESLVGNLRPRSLMALNNSNFSESQRRVIQYPEDYDAMWRSGFASASRMPQPYVNFDGEMVILVAAGTRPRIGYHIRVDSVVAGADLAVYVTESAPAVNCTTVNRIQAPAAIATIPWMDKPVRFVDAVRVGGSC